MFMRMLFKFSLFLALFSFVLKAPVVFSPSQQELHSVHNYSIYMATDSEKCVEPKTEETESWKGIIGLLHLPAPDLDFNNKENVSPIRLHLLSESQYHGFSETNRGPPGCPSV